MKYFYSNFCLLSNIYMAYYIYDYISANLGLYSYDMKGKTPFNSKISPFLL